ncbi:MAG: GNAT family N-acetyltransferase [Candidatus Thermoplasmatota archaeon]|jgi:ribosomal protein S18 acetylase RimI-like enzyme|nr:GNAT family N-acetyltransferase [Candidatus Thermoplasmatota archaeon]
MTQSIEFRTITKNDIDDLYEFLIALSTDAKTFFHPHKFDKKTLKQIYSSTKDHYFVLIKEKKIIGYSMLRLLGYNTPSFGVCIRNGYEHRGYGQLILDQTIQKAKQLGYQEVILTIDKENIRALNLYQKNGFEVIKSNLKTSKIKMKKILS